MNLNVTRFEAREKSANRANGSDRRDPRYGYGPYAKARIYFWLEGQSILENFFARGSEPHALVKPFIVPMALEAMGLPADTKATWSRKAGCSCGCSPAFIVDAPNEKGYDVFVTVSLTGGVAAKEQADAVA